MSVTRRFALLLLGCAGIALVVPVIVSLLIALVAAVVAVADASIARRPFQVNRQVTSVLSRGRTEPLVISLDGVSTRSSHLVKLRQPLPPDSELTVNEATGRELSSALTINRRGRHMLPAPAVAVDGPLGIGRWMHRPGVETPVTVYPDMHTAWRIADAVRRGRFSDPGLRTRGPLGLGTEFESIREYRPDDDIRLVNWKATARLGTPMSNNLRVEQDRDIMCCIDTGRLMASPIGTATRLDVAFDAVVALALVADEMGDRVGSVGFADTIRRYVAPGRKSGRRVIDAAIDLEPVLVDSNYELAFQRVGSMKRSLIVVLTDLIEPAATQPLLDAIGILSRRHVVVVASVDDPDIAALAAGPTFVASGDDPTRKLTTMLSRSSSKKPEGAKAARASGAIDVARTRLAGDLVADRDAAASALRSMGAIVVIAPPDRFAATVVDSYLRTKRLARL